ncbi:MAG: hypothetical protein COB30_017745 [Ectothiorhodospiraceae bacterium]|nr:hypothetical protein [Ectothiorhodospiraceae bacterium]
MMQSVGRKYVRYINNQYRRTGTLWEGRYKASLVDSTNYLITCMRYIELNPVRAGMVEKNWGQVFPCHFWSWLLISTNGKTTQDRISWRYLSRHLFVN